MMPEPKFKELGVPVDVNDDLPSMSINARCQTCGGGSNGLSKMSVSSTTKSCPDGVPKSSAHSMAFPACCSRAFWSRNSAFSAFKLASCCAMFEELMLSPEPSCELEPEHLLGLLVRSGSAHSGASAGFTSSSVHKAGGICTTARGCTYRSSRSLCLFDGVSSSLGRKTSATLLTLKLVAVCHATCCSRHRSTACSKCFIFFSVTQVPSSVM
mmetsp:Transcript_1938/g.3554  ORF Transcript_1938/g.3554 Transcript_1938/m.3554 type:complete len:212 (+) Transcript_1938:251-886(+)